MKNIILARKGSALLISMFITTIILLIAIYLLDKIIPYSRDIKGVENGNVAYYRATTAINEALLAMSSSDPGYETGATTMTTNGSGYVLNVSAKGTILPKSGEGTSEYNRDWNKIGLGSPVQLILPGGINWTTSTVTFRVPDLNKDGSNTETLSGTTTPIINWILSGSGEVLIASGTQIMANQIDGTSMIFSSKGGMTLSGTSLTFNAFYGGMYCSAQCTLKLSVINPLTLQSTSETVPYLEYQANFNVPIPLQFATISAEGYAAGFRQNITRYIQQLTTNEAMDFTVFQ